LCLAALRWHGYRSGNRYIVFPVLPHTLGLGPEAWRVLAKCHDSRNASEYEGDLQINERIVADLLSACNASSKPGAVQSDFYIRAHAAVEGVPLLTRRAPLQSSLPQREADQSTHPLSRYTRAINPNRAVVSSLAAISVAPLYACALTAAA
jgi:hypothetical protein